jgi:hypothetical protein
VARDDEEGNRGVAGGLFVFQIVETKDIVGCAVKGLVIVYLRR